jgi:hypothetical protein
MVLVEVVVATVAVRQVLVVPAVVVLVALRVLLVAQEPSTPVLVVVLVDTAVQVVLVDLGW